MRFFLTTFFFSLACGTMGAHGAAWQIVASPTTKSLQHVVWGNGHWVAASVDFDGATHLIHSDDGVQWQTGGTTPLSIDGNLYPAGRLFFSGGRFLITSGYFLGETITWASSVDGKTWTPFPVPEGLIIRDVAYAGGRWVCVGDGGTFATALSPGEWTVDNSRITGTSMTRVIWFGGRFHAFGGDSQGLLHYTSPPDASSWSLQPRAPILISLDSSGSLETGSLRTVNGAVEDVIVLTSNIQPFLIGRSTASGGIAWTAFSRQAFGGLYPRKSVDPTQPDGFRHDWVKRNPLNSTVAQVAVLQLQQSNETPAVESLSSSLNIYALGSGPDAMIAVGEGGLIRRYPTGLDSVTAPVDLEIAPAIQLKWSSRIGHAYLVEHSPDGTNWQAWLPAQTGTGLPMTWTQPAGESRRFFRIREQ